LKGIPTSTYVFMISTLQEAGAIVIA